ncbi:Uncharacterised protein [Mycobacteroides abscessus subsp. abscessus]|nr:Uncharacterised protein [Mycobacteroides abscessus subsp. abscessus]
MKVDDAPYSIAASTNPCGVNFSRMTLRPPLTRCGRKNAPLPCVIGAACSITDSGPRSGSRSTRKFATSASSLRVVRMTAFGLPVVPPV